MTELDILSTKLTIANERINQLQDKSTCKWKKEKHFIRNPHTNRLFSNEDSMQNVYCNTCGKKLEII